MGRANRRAVAMDRLPAERGGWAGKARTSVRPAWAETPSTPVVSKLKLPIRVTPRSPWGVFTAPICTQAASLLAPRAPQCSRG